MNEIETLKQVQWLPAGKTCQPLTDLGVAHGFFGKQDVAPERHHARQIHGTKLVEAEDLLTGGGSTRRTEADAIFTRRPGTTVAVKTADCLPIIMIDSAKRAAVVIHAGWRGLTSGIVGHVVSSMRDLGIKPADWSAAIGPAIARESYEVGFEVIEALETGGIDLNPAQIGLSTSKGKGDRWHLDSVVAGAFALANAGLPPSHIHVVQVDTFRANEWHSYRREGAGGKSNWSWITL